MKIKELKNVIYFAYGHNSNSHVMRHRCPTAEYMGLGILKNFELRIHHYADIEYHLGSEVVGVLWRIDHDDLSILDYDEGLHKDYDRIRVEVVNESGKIVPCYAYIMDPEHEVFKHKEKSYILSVARGYLEHGIPIEQLKSALN